MSSRTVWQVLFHPRYLIFKYKSLSYNLEGEVKSILRIRKLVSKWDFVLLLFVSLQSELDKFLPRNNISTSLHCSLVSLSTTCHAFKLLLFNAKISGQSLVCRAPLPPYCILDLKRAGSKVFLSWIRTTPRTRDLCHCRKLNMAS